MSAPPRALGALALLALGLPAAAEEPAFRLSFETERGEDGLTVKMYAQNTSKALATIDDDPYVQEAVVHTVDGADYRLEVRPNFDMMSRSGPRHRWISVKAGERLYVGSAIIPLTEEQAKLEGSLNLKIDVLTPAGSTTTTATVALGKLDS